MSISNVDEAAFLIRKSPNADFVGPRSDKVIQNAEALLGFTFPPSYRRFLKELGCGNIGGWDFFGVIHDDFANSASPDAVWLTLKLRKESCAANSLLFVSDTGDGGYYAIETSSKSPDGENPVVEWWPGPSQAADENVVVANDFGAFFLQQVSEALSAEE